MLGFITLLEDLITVQLSSVDYVQVVSIGSLLDDRVTLLELFLFHRIDDDS
jgi:hypothetical protein